MKLWPRLQRLSAPPQPPGSTLAKGPCAGAAASRPAAALSEGPCRPSQLRRSRGGGPCGVAARWAADRDGGGAGGGTQAAAAAEALTIVAAGGAAAGALAILEGQLAGNAAAARGLLGGGGRAAAKAAALGEVGMQQVQGRGPWCGRVVGEGHPAQDCAQRQPGRLGRKRVGGSGLRSYAWHATVWQQGSGWHWTITWVAGDEC